LLFLVLIAGWWNSLDSAISIAFRLREIQDDENDGKVTLTARQKIEFAGRIVRGLFGLILVVVAFSLALGT